MTYVDAGYAIALSVLALYALSLILRARRLERAAGAADARRTGALRTTEAAPVDPRR